ncbi:MAG: hypothetical protein JOY80_00570 [Candidatus Dormibacteraeota bacterium]|nr:hypothetical protein [Candidatus Dormibacteraeota bacterium]
MDDIKVRPRPRVIAESSEDRREDRNEYLRTLDADYLALRADHQNYITLTGALFSLAVALFGPLGYWLASNCFQSPALQCNGVPPELLAVVPIGPLGIIGFFTVLSNTNLIRSYYMRMVEAELQRVARAPGVSFRGGEQMRLPSLAHVTEAVVSQRRGVLRYRLLNLLSVTSLGVLFAGSTALCVLFTRPIDLQILAAAFYAFVIVMLALVIRDDTRGGLAMWRMATRLSSMPTDTVAAVRPGRPFWSYLLLPRPGDLIYKGTIIPIAWLLSAAVVGISAAQFCVVVAVTAVFEFLFYQARYTLNDLRGLGADAGYSTFKERNRFPAWAGRHEIRVALAVTMLRIIAALWITIRVFPDPYRLALLAGMGAVVIEATLYEWLRTTISPRVGRDLRDLTAGRAAILALVGAGYAIRTAIGLVLGRVAPDWILAGFGAAMMVAFGGMFVTMTWTVDGISQVVAGSATEFPSRRYKAALDQETHIGPLLRQARLLSADGPLERVDRPSTSGTSDAWRDDVQPLRSVSSATWWNLAFVVAAALAAMTGVLLAVGEQWQIVLLLAAMGGAVALLVLATHQGGAAHLPRTPATAVPVLIVVVACAVLILATGVRGVAESVVVWAPFALVGLVYLLFRVTTRRLVLFDPGLVTAAARRALSAALRRAMLAVLGKEAADRLRARG